MNISKLQQYFIKYLRLILNKSGLRRKRTVVFCAPADFHFQHLLPIIKMIEGTPHLKLIIVEQPDWQQKPDIKNSVFILGKDLGKMNWNFFDVMIGTDFSSIPWWFTSGTRIALFHGAGPKVGFLEELAENIFDVVFTPGPDLRELEEKIIENTKGRNTKLLQIGLPALDILFHQGQKNEIQRKNNKPVILYAPSWHLETSYIVIDEAFIRELAGQNKYHIIVRPHPNLLIPEKCGGIDWEKILFSYENENFEIPLQGSIYDYLHRCEAIIGDYSSVLYEYLVFERPGFLYVSQEVLDKVLSYGACEPDSDAIIEPLCAAYQTIPDATMLLEILDKGMQKPDIRQNARIELLNRTFYNAGSATQVASREIIRLLDFNRI